MNREIIAPDMNPAQLLPLGIRPHGHKGPFLAVGIRMGLLALLLLDSTGFNGICLLGFVPYRGWAQAFGLEVRDHRPAVPRRIGYLPQELFFPPAPPAGPWTLCSWASLVGSGFARGCPRKSGSGRWRP